MYFTQRFQCFRCLYGHKNGRFYSCFLFGNNYRANWSISTSLGFMLNSFHN
nr:MAG TPA: hypothetical protein [Caudoviricetes sp.]